MSEKIKLVHGDTRPALVCNLTDDITGAVIDLTGSSALLKFRMQGSTTLQATVPGVVTDGAAGQVVFFPATVPAMLQGEAGLYEGEIEITFPDGQIQTVYDLLKFQIRQDF